MLKSCQNTINALDDVKISYPFKKRPPPDNARYWKAFDELTAEPDYACAIVGLTKPDWHWVVIKNVTPKRLYFIDSDLKKPTWATNRSNIFAGNYRSSAKKSMAFVRKELIVFSRKSISDES